MFVVNYLLLAVVSWLSLYAPFISFVKNGIHSFRKADADHSSKNFFLFRKIAQNEKKALLTEYILAEGFT